MQFWTYKEILKNNKFQYLGQNIDPGYIIFSFADFVLTIVFRRDILNITTNNERQHTDEKA